MEGGSTSVHGESEDTGMTVDSSAGVEDQMEWHGEAVMDTISEPVDGVFGNDSRVFDVKETESSAFAQVRTGTPYPWH